MLPFLPRQLTETNIIGCAKSIYANLVTVINCRDELGEKSVFQRKRRRVRGAGRPGRVLRMGINHLRETRRLGSVNYASA